MIPLRDVIPSRTKPVITLSLIVINVLMFLFQASLSERGQEAFVYAHSRVLMLFPFPVFLFELPAIVFLGMWFFLQFLNGIGQLPVFQQDQISGGVAFWSHVMGFITGLILVVFMKRPERTRVEW